MHPGIKKVNAKPLFNCLILRRIYDPETYLYMFDIYVYICMCMFFLQFGSPLPGNFPWPGRVANSGPAHFHGAEELLRSPEELREASERSYL